MKDQVTGIEARFPLRVLRPCICATNKPPLLCDLCGGWQLSSDVWVQFDWVDLVNKSQMRVLVVDDYESWRRYFSTTIRNELGIRVIDEVLDGLDAVQQAERLQPDLILLDIGLPRPNGIEAARRIRKVSPASKIIFVSENRSPDIAEEALSTGAGGYLLKSDAQRELLPAVEAVVRGKRFVSTSLADHLNGPIDPQTGSRFPRRNLATLIPTQNVRIAGTR